MFVFNFFFQSLLLRSLFLFLLILVIYGPVLNRPFMLEDELIFGYWFRPMNFESILACFDSQGRNIIYFRPVISLFNLLLFNISAGEVVLYRLASIMLYTFFLLLLYQLTEQLFKGKLLPAVTVVLFCVHPINAFYVNHLSASANLIWGILFIGVLVSHINYLHNCKRVWIVAAFVLAGLAVLTHEMTIILPGFIVLIGMFTGSSWQKSFKDAIKYGLVIGIFFIVRSCVMPSSSNMWSMIKTGTDVVGLNIENYLASMGVLLGWFFQQLVWPSHVLFMKTILPVKENVGGILFLMGMTAIVTLISFLVVKELKWKFLISWFLLGVVPFVLASLIYPFEGITIEPHWLMMASLAFFWMMALVFQKVFDRFGRGVSIGLLSVVIVGAVIVTQKYNDLWRLQRSYCLYWLSVQPDQKIAHFWLAMDYFKGREYALAKEHFKRSLNRSFMDWEVYSNLGVIALLEGDLKNAVVLSQNALKINPKAAEALFNLGIVAQQQGRISEAIDLFTRAIHADPSFLPARERLNEIAQIDQ